MNEQLTLSLSLLQCLYSVGCPGTWGVFWRSWTAPSGRAGSRRGGGCGGVRRRGTSWWSPAPSSEPPPAPPGPPSDKQHTHHVNTDSTYTMYINRIYKHIIISHADIQYVFTAINWTRIFDFQRIYLIAILVPMNRGIKYHFSIQW